MPSGSRPGRRRRPESVPDDGRFSDDSSSVSHRIFATPQSRTSTSPKAPTMMFDGLRSRWTTPAAWAKATVSAMRSKTARRGGLAGERRGVLRQRLAAHVLHHVEPAAVVERAGVVHRHDPRMLEVGQHPRLLAQPRLEIARRRRRVRHLDRDLALEPPIVGGVDRAHAAAADRPADLVAIRRQRRPRRRLAEPRDRAVGEPLPAARATAGHGSISRPKISRASRRYSSSVAESARRWPSARSRNWRRAACRWLVTWLTLMPSPAATLA